MGHEPTPPPALFQAGSASETPRNWDLQGLHQLIELERIYSAELELLRARLARSESEGCNASNAEANWLAQQCRVLRLQNAKMQRTVRKLGGVHARK